MNVLQDAICFNNEGSRLLRKGRLLDAAHVLRQAAAMVQTASFYNDAAGSSSSLTVPFTIRAGSVEPQSDSCALHDYTQKDGTIYVYARPMLHPTWVQVTSLDDLSSLLRSVNCCIGFNLALACHLHGMETGSSVALDRAMELYQILLSGLCLDPEDNVITDSMSNGFLQCVILNNLSHIHSELCEHGYSIYCMDCMVDLIGKMGSSLYDTGYLDPRESDGILLNLMARQYFGVAPAAWEMLQKQIVQWSLTLDLAFQTYCVGLSARVGSTVFSLT
jgi:hypothetical protein